MAGIVLVPPGMRYERWCIIWPSVLLLFVQCLSWPQSPGVTYLGGWPWILAPTLNLYSWMIEQYPCRYDLASWPWQNIRWWFFCFTSLLSWTWLIILLEVNFTHTHNSMKFDSNILFQSQLVLRLSVKYDVFLTRVCSATDESKDTASRISCLSVTRNSKPWCCTCRQSFMNNQTNHLCDNGFLMSPRSPFSTIIVVVDINIISHVQMPIHSCEPLEPRQDHRR